MQPTSLEQAKPIKLAIFDVDGVLTNGFLTFHTDGIESKSFHVHDGLGMKLLQKCGIHVAIITGHQSAAVTKRMQELEVAHTYQNCADKLPAYEDLKQKLQVNDTQIAYMGDDLPDLPLLRRAGLAITVPNASPIIQQHAHYITKAKAGKGAVREACELILQTQGHYEQIIQTYLQR